MLLLSLMPCCLAEMGRISLLGSVDELSFASPYNWTRRSTFSELQATEAWLPLEYYTPCAFGAPTVSDSTHAPSQMCFFLFFFTEVRWEKKVCKDSHLTTWLLCGSSQSSLSVHTFGLTQHWSIQLLTKSAGGSWSNEQETRLCALNGDWRINSHFCGTIRNRLD